jgi:hypothetical protein
MAGLLHDLLVATSVAGRASVGLVFVLAATQKAMHWRFLPAVIANYRLLPRGMSGLVAALLPPVEMMLGIGLLSAQLKPLPELAALTLLLVFAVAMAINIGRGRSHIDCGCGESFLRQSLSWALVARNALLAILLVPSLLATERMGMSLAFSGIAAGLGLFLLYLLFNLLAALPPVERRGHRFA